MQEDQNRQSGLFWLTGSQPFHLMRGVSDSLTGRIGIKNPPSGLGFPDPPADLPVTPQEHRHRIPDHLKVVVHPVPVDYTMTIARWRRSHEFLRT